MRTLEQQITQYAAYHRDRRNITTHFVGVPMIVFSVLMALVPYALGGINVALIVLTIVAIYYLYLDRVLGTAMLMSLFVGYLVAVYLNARIGNANIMLSVAGVLFVLGWILQLVGHRYEGIKPAFTTDLAGLIIGPLFVMAEIFFKLGLKNNLKDYVEARVGPTLAARNGAAIGPVVGDAAGQTQA